MRKKLSITSLLIISLSLSFLNGCYHSSSNVKFSPSESSNPSKALVYIYRPFRLIVLGDLFGSAETIYINEKKLIDLENQSYTAFSIDPGQYTIELEKLAISALSGLMKSAGAKKGGKTIEHRKIDVNLEAGQEYYIQFISKDRRFSLAPKEEALKDISQTYFMEVDPAQSLM